MSAASSRALPSPQIHLDGGYWAFYIDLTARWAVARRFSWFSHGRLSWRLNFGPIAVSRRQSHDFLRGKAGVLASIRRGAIFTELIFVGNVRFTSPWRPASGTVLHLPFFGPDCIALFLAAGGFRAGIMSGRTASCLVGFVFRRLAICEGVTVVGTVTGDLGRGVGRDG